MNRSRLALTPLVFMGLLASGASSALGAQMAAAPAVSSAKSLPQGPLSHDAAAALMPATVFFAGQVASVQQRNTGGVKMPAGVMVAGIVDTAGYSTAVQEKYQAYLLLDAPVRIGDKVLPPGAYGCGIVTGEFLVLDLGSSVLLRVAATRDAELRRPTPLQVIADSAHPGGYRLYFGRSFVPFAPAPARAAQ